MWTREEVQRILESHRNYDLLFEEYEGKFGCEYFVAGVRILVFNCVGGMPEIWFGYSFDRNADFATAKTFVKIAYTILKERANH